MPDDDKLEALVMAAICGAAIDPHGASPEQIATRAVQIARATLAELSLSEAAGD